MTLHRITCAHRKLQVYVLIVVCHEK